MDNQLQPIESAANIARVQVTPAQALEAYNALKDITKKVLVPGTDYGKIPGTPKPTLLKSGAENLLRFYGLGHRLQVIEQVKDWENGFFYFSYKVTVHRTSETGVEFVLSECEGSANSKEKRYRNQDAYMLVNTLQKMAIKRALVGATLQATGASGLFTQDIEDMDSSYNSNSPSSNQPKSNGSNGAATEAQIKAINSGAKRKGLTEEEINQLSSNIHKVDTLKSLTKQQASDMITLFNSSTEEELKGMLGSASEHS
ncbi:hypothetical protein CAY60_017925 [Shouchella clausii]|uniref:hypothetical protein n=1 Tax=Shouchella TaxID=2893057 RepID=UPI0004E6DAC1|nr:MULTISPECIES: hypothetical protein [Shouchella]MCM3312007.1 hypothetical protein [Psychrobacillus sp. MER TA 17]ALA55033.1 hypothetical protein DB29_04205 [Shouchella clausii]MBU3231006.1 hypothetical protein [Shouchella clausii]MBU3262919.1 hypothetical protein [Shouchella clausii]MBU3505384.1 hypothetical protein [Shouchella clausii]